MATYDETVQALQDAIKAHADFAAGARGSVLESRASAVLQLAEAYAWLCSPSQPHGGAAKVQVEK